MKQVSILSSLCPVGRKEQKEAGNRCWGSQSIVPLISNSHLKRIVSKTEINVSPPIQPSQRSPIFVNTSSPLPGACPDVQESSRTSVPSDHPSSPKIPPRADHVSLPAAQPPRSRRRMPPIPGCFPASSAAPFV